MEEIKELKVQAYDAIAQLEYWQKVLQELNAKIAQLSQETEKKWIYSNSP